MDAPWIKAYVHSAKFRTTPQERHIRDVLFTTKIEDAMHYDSREEAQSDVQLIFENRIQIDTIGGFKHTLEHFRVEERSPKEFVIWCEGPFTIT